MSRCAAIGAVALAVSFLAGSALAQDNPADLGKEVYKRANCVGCHKWSGIGGGGYGGAALSLRKTALSKDQIEMTVRCGRPGTGMPYFDRDSYPTDPSKPIACYGLSRKTLAKLTVAQGGVFLRPEEIDAVADYVVHHIKGKGAPDLADCTAFFGDSSACDIYRTGHQPHVMPTPTTTQ